MAVQASRSVPNCSLPAGTPASMRVTRLTQGTLPMRPWPPPSLRPWPSPDSSQEVLQRVPRLECLSKTWTVVQQLHLYRVHVQRMDLQLHVEVQAVRFRQVED